MAVIISEKEAANRVASCRRMMELLERKRREIGIYAAQLEREGNTAESVATAVNAMLTDWDAMRDQLVTEISAIPNTYQSVARVGMPARYNYAVINASSQNSILFGGDNEPVSVGIIRVCPEAEHEISPFSCFASGDIVTITNAEDDSNKVSGKVLWTPATPQTDRIVNGNFTSASSWTETGDGGTEIVITGGKAVFTAATCTLAQAKADMTGGGWTNAVRHIIEFDLDTVSAGTLSVGTLTSAAQFTASASGHYEVVILSDNETVGLLFTAANFTGNLDNVRAYPFTGIALDVPLGVDNTSDTKLEITLSER